MAVPQQHLDEATALQQKLEKDLMSKKGVNGVSVSTMPGAHDKVCLKVIVDNKKLDAKALGIKEKYGNIPVVISEEKITLM